jgi:high-affinity Fe2+/Pb2+ permease
MNKQNHQRIIYGVMIAVLLLLLLFYMMRPNKSTKVLEPKTNFEVIDTYKGCDVVRYSAPNGANYHYFLDCQK